jgi:hypothetical protein
VAAHERGKGPGHRLPVFQRRQRDLLQRHDATDPCLGRVPTEVADPAAERFGELPATGQLELLAREPVLIIELVPGDLDPVSGGR